VSKPPVVRAYVTDLDGTGTPITDRKPQHYRLLVDGLPQTGASRLQRFHEAGEPVAMVLVVQVSPAMRDALTEAGEASKRLGDGLRGREDALEVQLPDAIRDALESLDSSALPRQRALVVVSDGLTADLNFSLFSELGRRAQEKAVVVHGIGYAPLEPAHLRTLHELSRRSGGTTREAKDADGVVRGFAALQAAIRHQVVVSYALPARGAGQGEALVQGDVVPGDHYRPGAGGADRSGAARSSLEGARRPPGSRSPRLSRR